MKAEHERRGVRLFVFHDDNFFLPYLPKNLERYERLGALLRGEGLDDIALVLKCRPNDVDPELFALLQALGMIRAYVGIETNSDEGIVSLNRRITPEDNRRALAVFRALGIYCSFNVLLFDPEATLAGIEKNLDFMADHTDIPFNFCRAEVYAGTPLKGMLETQGRLRGDYLAWTYEMRDPRVELLFRIATTAFCRSQLQARRPRQPQHGHPLRQRGPSPLLPRGVGPGLARAAHGVLPGRRPRLGRANAGSARVRPGGGAPRPQEHPLRHPRSDAGGGPGGSGPAGHGEGAAARDGGPGSRGRGPSHPAPRPGHARLGRRDRPPGRLRGSRGFDRAPARTRARRCALAERRATMKLRKLQEKALLGGAISLGTAGLSNCMNGGSGGVDPPPPPYRCENLDALRDLQATVSRGVGDVLIVRISYEGREPARLETLPVVSVVEGAMVRAVRPGDEPGRQVIVELLPVSPTPSRIWFVLDGHFAGYYGDTCLFQRGFTITFDGAWAIAESRLALPFDTQARAAIVVTGRDGPRVALRAEANPPGQHHAWTVTGGTFRAEGGESIVWNLPREPGLYQVELLVDHGEHGFAFDALALEVLGGHDADRSRLDD